MTLPFGAAPGLKAPFPYFGGKGQAAAEVWRRFGDVRSYVEPFFGSGAVLLKRPQPFRGVETVNDADGLLCNFWRALQAHPEEVARWADWPVNEADLHARNAWLIGQRASLTNALIADPDFCDPKAAGWWVWGASASIGHNWCGPALIKGIPAVGDAGSGIHRASIRSVSDELLGLSSRLRKVRVTCGDWSRICTESIITQGGVVSAVFLDPPYLYGRADYAVGGGGTSLAADVAAWAREYERHPLMRLALCGREGEHYLPGWSIHLWKWKGGYQNRGTGEHRECIWFSPNCLGAQQPSLFG